MYNIFTFKVACVVLAIIVSNCNGTGISNSQLLTKLDVVKNVTARQLLLIRKEWDIDNYPIFLESCGMSRSAWMELVLKFVDVIVDSSGYNSDNDSSFTISYSGTSITAGHDSYFNQSYPRVVVEYLQPVFDAATIRFNVRSVAYGNNPCMPYAPCRSTISGHDADIVHWEQTIECEGDFEMYEQVVRQSSFLSKRPIIVFDHSHVSTWHESDCVVVEPGTDSVLEPVPDHLGASETENTIYGAKNSFEMLRGIEDLVSGRNLPSLLLKFYPLASIAAAYSDTSIQMFHHSVPESYKCKGPYVPTWSNGAEAWHPSVAGHRLRAAHHSFFWLLGFREALHLVEESVAELEFKSLPLLLKKVKKTIRSNLKLSHPGSESKRSDPATSMAKSHIPDRVQCFTDMVPRAILENTISSLVVAGQVVQGNVSTYTMAPDKWSSVIQENLIRPSIIKNAVAHQEIDFKYAIFGCNASGPLSLLLDVKGHGKAFVCETRGFWDILPPKVAHLSLKDEVIELYVTEDVDVDMGNPQSAKNDFDFMKEKAKHVSFHHVNTRGMCYELHHDFFPGKHVLTVVPTSDQFVSLSYVLIP